MYTEEQAKKMWCPMVRSADENGRSFNKVWDNDPRYSGYQDTRCMPSECPMWRWSRDVFLKAITSKRDDRICITGTEIEALSIPTFVSEMPTPKGEGWEPVGVPEPADDGEPYFLLNWKRNVAPERKGYCGLAGKPC